MLKKQIDNRQYKYYKYIISAIDEFLEYENIKPLDNLISNLHLLHHRYRDAMFEDLNDYKILHRLYYSKDTVALKCFRENLIFKMNLLV